MFLTYYSIPVIVTNNAGNLQWFISIYSYLHIFIDFIIDFIPCVITPHIFVMIVVLIVNSVSFTHCDDMG